MVVEPGHVPLSADCFPVSMAWEKEMSKRRTRRDNVDLGVILIGEGVGEGW